MTLPGTSISVLCHNKPETLAATLAALDRTLVAPFEVTLVDNGSTDPETIRMLASREQESGWFVIRNSRNLGLSRGVNVGLSRCSVGMMEGYGYTYLSNKSMYDCLIRLDDDCVINTVGWNQTMRRYLIDYPKVGLVIPMSAGEFIQREGYQEIRWGLGMVWAMRRSLYDDIGGYDPQLHHQNECDLSLRVRMAGFHVAAIQDFYAHHNDPGGPKSDVAEAREHIGVIQYLDKWGTLFKGRENLYGKGRTLYLSQHFPPDQDWYHRYAEAHGFNLNPAPNPDADLAPGATLGLTEETAKKLTGDRRVNIDGLWFMLYWDLRNDYAYWVDTEAYWADRVKWIARWNELTGELYTGYKWPNYLNPARSS